MVQDYKYGFSLEIKKYTFKKGEITYVKISQQGVNVKVVTNSGLFKILIMNNCCSKFNYIIKKII